MWFHEAFEATIPALYELDSFRYRVEYSYQADGTYPHDELALQIIGAHSGLMTDTADLEQSEHLPFYLVSQIYERSHVQMTDLHTNETEEVLVLEDGVWFRPPHESGWLVHFLRSFKSHQPGRNTLPTLIALHANWWELQSRNPR